MKRFIPSSALFVFLAFLVPTMAIAGGKSVPVVPIQGKVIPVVLNGSEKNYYELPHGGSVRVKVQGPAKLEVLTRLSLPKQGSGIEKYSVKVVESGQVAKEYNTSTERSDASYKNSDLVPGKSRKFTMDVAEGAHTYDFHLEGTERPNAALKFSLITAKGKAKGVTLEPLSYDRVVTAVVKEKLITYYVATKEHQVQLRIVGPTRLQVTARLNFDAAMKGEQPYALAVWEGGKRIQLKPQSTTKSLGIAYEEWKDVVPGKSDTIVLDVPKGEYTYKFSLEESKGQSISLKFAIPRKDLGNED